MSSKVLYSKEATKDIKKLDSVVKKKLAKAIEKYSKNPLENAKRLSLPGETLYKWRAGSYRIIFDISGKTIRVLRAGHRRDIYK